MNLQLVASRAPVAASAVSVAAAAATHPRSQRGARAQRHDLFALIHKALRLALTDTLARVGRLDTDDESEVTSMTLALRETIALCRMHLEKEEAFVHPALEAAAPGSTRRTATEHRDHLHALDRLESALSAVVRSAGAARAAAAAALYRRLALLAAESFVHMNGEEVADNAVLWAAYSDDDIAAIERRIVASIAPAEMITVLNRMAPAMNPSERAKFFANLRAKLPPPAFAAAMNEVIGELDADAKHKLLRALGH